MGLVSGAVLESGGDVTGVVPLAMVAAGGEGQAEGDKINVILNEKGREKVRTEIISCQMFKFIHVVDLCR